LTFLCLTSSLIVFFDACDPRARPTRYCSEARAQVKRSMRELDPEVSGAAVEEELKARFASLAADRRAG